MSEPFPRKRPAGLGRGLSSLLGEAQQEASVRPGGEAPKGAVQLIPIAGIEPHPGQPRRIFQEEALAELALSIQARGVIQPIIVRPHGHRFQIVAFSRSVWRWKHRQAIRRVDNPVDKFQRKAAIVSGRPRSNDQERDD